MPNYQYSDLKTAINGGIYNKIGMLSSEITTINSAIREVRAVRLHSLKRRTLLAPNLFNDVYEYTAPTDLDGLGVIGIQPQNQERIESDYWNHVALEEFDQYKTVKNNLLAISSNGLVKKLLISANVDDDSIVVGTLNTVAENGANWTAYGDGENLTSDSSDYVKGGGSVKFDISSAGGTTVGVYHSSLPTFDLTKYLTDGSVFVWTKIISTTNITNYKIRLGSDASNYYEMTATTQNDGTAFATGWNLLRFDFSGKTTTGSPSSTACDYVAVFMTKDAGKVSETGYAFDHIMVKRGSYQYLWYYSNYAWQSSTGTFKIKATATNDYLNFDEDEFLLAVEKGIELAAREVREPEASLSAARRYKDMVREYRQKYPNESIPLISTYYNL